MMLFDQTQGGGNGGVRQTSVILDDELQRSAQYPASLVNLITGDLSGEGDFSAIYFYQARSGGIRPRRMGGILFKLIASLHHALQYACCS